MNILDSLRYAFSRKNTARGSKFHLKAAADWLLVAQQKGRGGFAHSYSLTGGWLPPYSETTGYLLPSLMQLSRHLQEPLYFQSVLTAAKWLVQVQNSDGSYDSLSNVPMVFNTGQIIQGLVAVFKHTHDSLFLDSAQKAGDWIVAQQDSDGSWIKNSYRGIPHSYYVKVAAALADLGEASGHKKFNEAAEKNLRWTLSQQKPNGFFEHTSFEKNKYPLLHTIVYVAEGLLDLYSQTSDPAVMAAVQKWGQSLLNIQRRDFPLYARYRDDWQSALYQQCVPGLCQWAQVGFRMFNLLRESEYKIAAMRTAHYLKSRQVISSSPALHGALPASIPIWGEYVPYSFVNWGVKYFIDALLSLEQLNIPFEDEKKIYTDNLGRETSQVAVH